MWLKIVRSGKQLWTPQRTFGFHKIPELLKELPTFQIRSWHKKQLLGQPLKLHCNPEERQKGHVWYFAHDNIWAILVKVISWQNRKKIFATRTNNTKTIQYYGLKWNDSVRLFMYTMAVLSTTPQRRHAWNPTCYAGTPWKVRLWKTKNRPDEFPAPYHYEDGVGYS